MRELLLYPPHHRVSRRSSGRFFPRRCVDLDQAEGALGLLPTAPCPTGFGSEYNPMALVAAPRAGAPLSTEGA